MQPVMVSSIPALTILYRSKRVLGSTAFSYRQEMNTQFIKIILCFIVSLEYLYTGSVQLSGKNNALKSILSIDTEKKTQQTKQTDEAKPNCSSTVILRFNTLRYLISCAAHTVFYQFCIKYRLQLKSTFYSVFKKSLQIMNQNIPNIIFLLYQ